MKKPDLDAAISCTKVRLLVSATDIIDKPPSIRLRRIFQAIATMSGS
jgi:hypothetical protein